MVAYISLRPRLGTGASFGEVSVVVDWGLPQHVGNLIQSHLSTWKGIMPIPILTKMLFGGIGGVCEAKMLKTASKHAQWYAESRADSAM